MANIFIGTISAEDVSINKLDLASRVTIIEEKMAALEIKVQELLDSPRLSKIEPAKVREVLIQSLDTLKQDLSPATSLL